MQETEMHTTLPSNVHQEIKTETFKMPVPSFSPPPYIYPFIHLYLWLPMEFMFQLPGTSLWKKEASPLAHKQAHLFLLFYFLCISWGLYITLLSFWNWLINYNGGVKTPTFAFHSFTFGLSRSWSWWEEASRCDIWWEIFDCQWKKRASLFGFHSLHS